LKDLEELEGIWRIPTEFFLIDVETWSRLNHHTVFTQLPLSMMLTTTHFYCWDRFLLPPMPTNPGFVFDLLPPCWSSFLLPKICLLESFEAWTIVWMLEIRRFLGLRGCSPFLFYFIFLETPQFQGVPLLLLGTLLCLRECVGILGSCASMHNASNLQIQGTFLP